MTARTLRFTPEAKRDLRDAFRWYQRQRRGLGLEFNAQVDVAVRSAAREPEAHLVVHADVRRALVHRFPYGIFFVADTEGIVVIAVMHHRRDPEVWRARAGGD